MCHPWFAAAATTFVVICLGRELAPVVCEDAPRALVSVDGLLGARLRAWFRCRMSPLVDAFLRMGLSANDATILQLGASVVCGLAYAHGMMFTAGWMVIFCGTLDVLDGEMARRRGLAGPRGAFLDSVADRCGESAIFAGLVAFYRDAWVLWWVLAAWAGGFLVSYTRARAESLGIDCREGLLQRPERYVVLGSTSMASAIAGHLACSASGGHRLVTLGICVLALLGNATAFQRTRAALRRLA